MKPVTFWGAAACRRFAPPQVMADPKAGLSFPHSQLAMYVLSLPRKDGTVVPKNVEEPGSISAA
jgi:hypothetical protein